MSLIQWTPSRSTQTGNERFFSPSLRTTLLIEITTFRTHITHCAPAPLPYSLPGPNLSLRSVSPTHTTPPIRLLSIANAHALFAPCPSYFSPSHACLAALPKIFFVSKFLWFLTLIFFVASNLIRQENKMCAYIGFLPHLYWRVLLGFVSHLILMIM